MNVEATKQPSVGRIVHYQAYGTPGGEFKSVPRAAVVTEVHDALRGEITVCVLNPSGIFFNRVKFDLEGKPGSWRWPPYEPPTAMQIEQTGTVID